MTVIDDYGHHPVEIAAVLKRRPRRDLGQGGGRVIAREMQPHRFTRLSTAVRPVLYLLRAGG